MTSTERAMCTEAEDMIAELRAGISWARGMCSDGRPVEEIDHFLGCVLAGHAQLPTAETTRDLRTHVGGGLYVKPLGHTPPESHGASDENCNDGETMLDEPTISPSEQAVQDVAVQTFRELLPVVAPNICGYEMRALPELVVEGARRTAANRDHYKRLYEQRGKDAADAEDHVEGLRGALEELQDEMVNFAHYSRSVAAEAVGQRRLMWQERADWADRLAGRARDAVALASREPQAPTEEDR